MSTSPPEGHPGTQDIGEQSVVSGAIDPASLTFEQAREALVTIVERLQNGTNSLQESLDLWERGERLAQRCEEFLAEARARLERVVTETRGGQTDGGGST